MTALDAIIDALWVCSGITTCVLGIAAAAHHLVGATRSGPPPESSQWAERVDPDRLLPPPLDRVAPPRERGPGGAS
jgi:hypothetical protein